MERVKNDCLKMITYLAALVAVLSGYMTELELFTRITLLLASIAWVALFLIANLRGDEHVQNK